MKGYVINNKCYIFPQEVGQIPSVEAEVIYVQEEDIKAWKEANAGVANKIKKYNYNVMTVNPKEWSGHKDDELVPVQTTYNITKEGDGIELISVVDQATTGETVTITLVDPETYTFDLTNKAKQRIYVNTNDDTYKEYHQEGDYYTFTMPDHDIGIIVARYGGLTLTVTIDGESGKSIEELNVIGSLEDGMFGGNITDLTDISPNIGISFNLQQGYSFNAEDTGKTIVVAKFNGTELTEGDAHYRQIWFTNENATLEITTTAPQS